MENAGIENEDRRRRTILASDLALHTDIIQVTRYTHSCKVTMSSVDSVAAILEKARHVINRREVIVEQYRGLAEHQWLFLKGKFKVTLKGLRVDLEPVDLYKMLEQVFAGCGRYSDIELRTRSRKLTGVAVIDFIKKGDARQAMKIAREVLNCQAFRIRSKTRP
nr:hypothetical protein [Tanacetum cinerariifolium]